MFDPDKHVSQKNKSAKEQFREDRLDRIGLSQSQWPAQIDRAALDILHGIAIGKADSTSDIGGTIDRVNFPDATGDFYTTGLVDLVGSRSSLDRELNRYDPHNIGELAFHLNEFRKELTDSGDQAMDVDRAIEALVEKAATEAIERSSRDRGNDGAGLRQLQDSNSASDIIVKLFSDPQVGAYADTLIEIIADRSTASKSLLDRLDEPRMTTPLWAHQKKALKNWRKSGQFGYVDMATATGKTVLGLAAIAVRYGKLHPADGDVLDGKTSGHSSSRPRILIIAGNDVLLNQWRGEFDTHLDIPPARTTAVETDSGKNIELGWGTIEFRTAQALLQTQSFHQYDLVILDEAHQYSRRGSDKSRGWRDLFADLVEQSTAILAMSGSVDGGWQGDSEAEGALAQNLDRCYQFDVSEAREQGVLADFQWEIHYAPVNDDDEKKLAEQTEITTRAFDSQTGEIDADALNIDEQAIDSPYDSYTDIRSFVQSNSGRDLRSHSDAFDLFASALLARFPVVWNLSSTIGSIIDLVDKHAPERKTVVLVQGYREAVIVRDQLVEERGYDPDTVFTLESGRDDRIGTIERFKNAPRGVIIGPGDLLGVGIDLPNAEVAINVSRGGVNASLVQRIGRILRNPTGEKEAYFYHIVPRPTTESAIDPHEDGRELLRQAAEFRGLGATFREQPAFSVASEDVTTAVSDLERAGAETLDRLSDKAIDRLVETKDAAKSLHTLHAAVNESLSGNKPTDCSVTVALWSRDGSHSHPTSTMQDHDIFPERNETYEQYRLHLDPYRAAKAFAENILGFDVSHISDGDTLTVDVPSEYENTDFRDHLVRWLNGYVEYRDACRNDDQDGEPGSLPAYRERWPEPREEDGAMLQADIAEQIGIDYAEQDPVFFPRIDGDIYELPLVEGRKLCIDSVKEVEPQTPADDSTDTPCATIDSLIVASARHSVEQSEEYKTLTSFITDCTRTLLKEAIDDETPPFVLDHRSGKTEAIELSGRDMSFISTICDEVDSPYSDPGAFVETAIRKKLDLVPGETTTMSIDVPVEIATAIKRTGVAEFNDTIESALRQGLDESTDL